MKERVISRIKELGSTANQDVTEVIEWIDDKEKRLKHQVHRFATFVETARQINARGLNLEHIESFSLNTIRGQILVNDVLMFRQDVVFGLNDVPLIKCFHRDIDVSFRADSPFARRLCEFAHAYTIRTDGHQEDIDREMLKFEEVKAFREAGYEVLVPLKLEDNEMLGLFVVGPKLNGDEFTGDDYSFMWLLAEMVSMSVHNAQLYQRSVTDGLTGVHSRGYFDCWLDEEFHRLNRYHRHGASDLGRQVSLMMIDIDHFKDVNDTYGHQVGDKVLLDVAECLQAKIRSSDQIARYGGEEFVIFCPESSIEEAAILGERLRKAVANLEHDVDGDKPLKVTVSIGLASYPETSAGERDLVFRADQALYAAKEGGRNKMVRADLLEQ